MTESSIAHDRLGQAHTICAQRAQQRRPAAHDRDALLPTTELEEYDRLARATGMRA